MWNILELRRSCPPLATSGATMNITVECEHDVMPGDVVRRSDTNLDIYARCSDNRSTNAAVGVVVEKMGVGSCNVVMTGLINLEVDKDSDYVFLSDTGGLTTVIPSDGFVQCMGFWVNSDTVYLQINYPRIKRNPF